MRWALLIRSFLIQGSWNYRTLIGTGLAWALLPVTGGRGATPVVELGERSSGEPFNAHPYLSTVAIGALARAASEGAAGDAVHRFRRALRSPLGSLGDKLVWGAWRPACLLAALLAALVGVQPAWIVVGLLVVYNAFHLLLRAWGLRIGLASGLGVGPLLARARLPAHAERIEGAGVLLAGSVLGVLLLRVLQGPAPGILWLAAGAGTVLVGALGGSAARRWTPWILILVVVLGCALGVSPAAPIVES